MANYYAKALYSLAVEENNLTVIKENFDIFQSVLEDEEELFEVMTSLISIEQKKAIIEQCLIDFEKEFIYFLYVVIENKKFHEIKTIYREFQVLYNMHFGLEVISCYVAYEVDEEKYNEILNQAQKLFKVKKASLNIIIDQEILNGYLLEYKGDTIDLTGKADMFKIKSIL